MGLKQDEEGRWQVDFHCARRLAKRDGHCRRSPYRVWDVRRNDDISTTKVGGSRARSAIVG